MSGRVRFKENGILNEDLPTLQETAYNVLSKNLYIFFYEDPITHENILRESIVLPLEISQKILEYHQDNNRQIDNKIVKIFQDIRRVPLKYVHLRNSSITNEGLEILLQHSLTSLSMWYCDEIDVAPNLLMKCRDTLKSLFLGLNVNLLKFREPKEKKPLNFVLDLPKLRYLGLNAVVLQLKLKFENLQQLVYLDLTSCIFADFNLEPLCGLQNLSTLILFNVWPLAEHFPTISQLTNLTTLDVSISGSGSLNHGKYVKPDEMLAMLVESLPNLTHLDISGTNLAGTGVAQKHGCDIPGLTSRINRPLQFLGLYHTENWACKRHDIPALQITGDANEEQILTSGIYYHDRPAVLTRVLNDLYHLLRFESCRSVHIALDIVLTAMDRHLRFKHMQITGSATLFYIVKGRDKSKFGTGIKNHIISTLLNGMESHITDETMLRNGYLTLCQFSMPYDVLFEYKRLIKILLHGVSKTEQEGFVQRIAIFLLNTLACQVDSRQKLFLGDLGVISTMLDLIKDRLSRTVQDDVLEVAWSTMWNVTDETAVNCERFLDGRGMEYFLTCLNSFPERGELLRNMMGLLGNVAEVKRLRSRLMTSKFINVFANLLDSISDGIEVSYNAAGVLAHIASDGDLEWKVSTPTRQEVLARMVKAIERWDLNSERNINYRSFQPILGLVKCYVTPECQHWAVWALANLTAVYPDKYCRLVEQENGIQILSDLNNHPSPYRRIKELACIVIDRCQNTKHKSLDLEG